jgi:hypothetical protein
MGTRYPEIFLKPSSLPESHRVLKNDQLRRARQNVQSEALTNFLLAYMGVSRQGHNPEIQKRACRKLGRRSPTL